MKKMVILVCVLYALTMAAGMTVSGDEGARKSGYLTQEQ